MADIPQLVQELLADGANLRRSGRAFRGPCPFHHDSNPSFEVSLSPRGYWRFKCWSTNCGVNGGLREYRKLAGRPDDQEPERQYKPPPNWYDTPSRELLATAALHYNQQLLEYPEATAYLRSRGVDPEQAQQWGIGYAPGNTLFRLLQQTMTEEELSRCMLLNHRRREDRSSRRIIFPHFGQDGQPGWHTARAIDPDAHMSYKSLPGRRPALLMLRNEITEDRTRPLVITEGPMDLLATLTAGLRGAATAGNPEPRRLPGAVNNAARGQVYVLPDRDAAGDGWADIVLTAATTRRRRPLLIKLPDTCSDPADAMNRPKVRAQAIYGTAIRKARWRNATDRPRVTPTTDQTEANEETPNSTHKEQNQMAHFYGPSINFFGNLTRDPENIARDGDPVASFRVAVNYRKYSRDEGEYVDATTYFGCRALGALGKRAMELREGQLVWISGSLQTNEREGREGDMRMFLDVHVHDLHDRLEWSQRSSGGRGRDRDDDDRGGRGRGRDRDDDRGGRNRNRDDDRGGRNRNRDDDRGGRSRDRDDDRGNRNRDRDDDRGDRNRARDNDTDRGDYNANDSLGTDDLPF